jgi:protein TonB
VRARAARSGAALLALGLALAGPALGQGGGAAADPRAVDLAPEAPSAEQRLAEIARLVQAQARYPELARLRGAEGEALVGFELDARGQPQGLTTELSSGSASLDRAAQEAVRRAAPLPWVLGRIQVPVSFVLLDAGAAAE